MVINKSLISTITLVFFFQLSVITTAQNLTLKTGEWLRSWYLAGPFPLEESSGKNEHLKGFDTDFLVNSGGEIKPRVKEGKEVEFNNVSVHWFKYESPDAVINLDIVISEVSFVTAYAYTEINSEKEGLYLFSLGTDDGAKLWFNGEKVLDYPGEVRGILQDDVLIPVNVRKGKNTILLKVEERRGSWGFNARLLPSGPSELADMITLFHVHLRTDGTPELRLSRNELFMEKMFKSAQLKIVDEDSENTIWQGDWTQKRNMILPVGNDEYKKNILIITATLTDGNLWEQEISFSSGIPPQYKLFENGKTNYRITVAKDASESEQWAAEELQHWLAGISGAVFPIQTDDEEIMEHEIIIGYNRHSLALLESGTTKPEDTNESYHYKNEGSTILLLGGKERGATSLSVKMGFGPEEATMPPQVRVPISLPSPISRNP